MAEPNNPVGGFDPNKPVDCEVTLEPNKLLGASDFASVGVPNKFLATADFFTLSDSATSTEPKIPLTGSDLDGSFTDSVRPAIEMGSDLEPNNPDDVDFAAPKIFPDELEFVIVLPKRGVELAKSPLPDPEADPNRPFAAGSSSDFKFAVSVNGAGFTSTFFGGVAGGVGCLAVSALFSQMIVSSGSLTTSWPSSLGGSSSSSGSFETSDTLRSSSRSSSSSW